MNGRLLFNTTLGHYENLEMPVGLTNAAAFFPNFVNDILRNLLNQKVPVYFNDILIISSDLKTLVANVS